jgi:hypothetical protein
MPACSAAPAASGPTASVSPARRSAARRAASSTGPRPAQGGRGRVEACLLPAGRAPALRPVFRSPQGEGGSLGEGGRNELCPVPRLVLRNPHAERDGRRAQAGETNSLLRAASCPGPSSGAEDGASARSSKTNSTGGGLVVPPCSASSSAIRTGSSPRDRRRNELPRPGRVVPGPVVRCAGRRPGAIEQNELARKRSRRPASLRRAVPVLTAEGEARRVTARKTNSGSRRRGPQA